MRSLAALLVAAVVSAGCGAGPAPAEAPPAAAPVSSAARVVDLAHPLSTDAPTWTGQPVFTHELTRGEGTLMGRFATDEHAGTHFDAPAHFGGAWTVDLVPEDRLVLVPAVRLDVTAQAGADDDYRVTRADIEAFERAHGAIPAGSVVFVHTGWAARWSDADRYRNERDGVKHFPGLSVEAASLLANDRKVAGIGIDTLSVDYGPSTEFEVHRTTQPQNVYHIENAASLADLPPTGFRVVVAPVKIAGGSGGPTRVFAVIP